MNRWHQEVVDSLRKTFLTFLTFKSSLQSTLAVDNSHISLFLTLVLHGSGSNLHIAIIASQRIHSSIDILIHTRLKRTSVFFKSTMDQALLPLFKLGTLFVSMKARITALKIQNLLMW